MESAKLLCKQLRCSLAAHCHSRCAHTLVFFFVGWFVLVIDGGKAALFSCIDDVAAYKIKRLQLIQ